MCQFLTGVGTITTAWSCCSGDENIVHLVATQFGRSHHPRSSKATNSHLLSAHGKGLELQESQTGFSLYRFIA